MNAVVEARTARRHQGIVVPHTPRKSQRAVAWLVFLVERLVTATLRWRWNDASVLQEGLADVEGTVSPVLGPVEDARVLARDQVDQPPKPLLGQVGDAQSRLIQLERIVLDIELGSRLEKYPVQLRRNILFVGTMNEDETTHALSDKALDRGNVIAFPSPRTMCSRDEFNLARAGGFLPEATWRG